MWNLIFPATDAASVMDRVFNRLPSVYPGIVSVRLHGDDGLHDQPFVDLESQSKVIQFCKMIVHQNRELTFDVIRQDDALTFVFTENDVQTTMCINGYQGDADWLESLGPICYDDGHRFWYSPVTDDVVGTVFVASKQQSISEKHIESYHFRNALMTASANLTVTEIESNVFVYEFNTLLPEDLSAERLIRIILYRIGSRLEHRNTLLGIHLHHEVMTERGMKDGHPIRTFQIPLKHVRGWINPIRKMIGLESF